MMAAGYEFHADAAKRTVTVYVTKQDYPISIATPTLTNCSATFKLTAGYAFNIKPPAGATCPANAITIARGGRKFCQFCKKGTYKKGGQCKACPTGTYQGLLGGTSCTICPAGTECSYSRTGGSSWKTTCFRGTYASKPGSPKCKGCPANTRANKAIGATACLPCPKFTASPPGSSTCIVPFQK
jgi:hypothetical protein